MEYYIKVLAEEGITHIPVWQQSSDATIDSVERIDTEDGSRSPQLARLQVKESGTNVEDNEGGRYKVI